MIIEDESGREWTTDELRDDYREPTEPDPEPPLDLDWVRQLISKHNVVHADVKEQREAERLLLDEVLPELLGEVSDFREAEEVWAELPTRTEWAAGPAEGTSPITRWYDSPERAERAYGKEGGQLWCRTLTIGAPVPISSEAPF